jgi:hypothetical protein
LPGQRQVILLHIDSLQTSCGFGLPRMQVVEQRQDMENWAKKKGPQGLAEYRQLKNRLSIDGLSTGLGEQTLR